LIIDSVLFVFTPLAALSDSKIEKKYYSSWWLDNLFTAGKEIN
jgi:hypothetical protein